MSARLKLERPHTIVVPPASADVERQIAAAARALARAKRVLVVSHECPDGDAIGSSLAMAWLATALGKRVAVANHDAVPANFAFLPGAERIERQVPTEEFDLVCVLDAPHPDRLGARLGAFVGESDRVMVIDHHKEHWPGDAVVVRDPSAAATAELIYRLAVEIDAPVDLRFAECVYCALLTDTGSFRYRSTTPAALSIAAAVVAYGVDAWHIASHVYESQPVERVELLGAALRTLQRSPCGRLATIRLDRSLLDRAGRADEFVDGIINHVRSVRGVEIACQLYELDHEVYSVTFRSRGSVEVGPLARRLGGSGGRFSGSATMRGSAALLVKEIQLTFQKTFDHGFASAETHPHCPEGT